MSATAEKDRTTTSGASKTRAKAKAEAQVEKADIDAIKLMLGEAVLKMDDLKNSLDDKEAVLVSGGEVNLMDLTREELAEAVGRLGWEIKDRYTKRDLVAILEGHDPDESAARRLMRSTWNEVKITRPVGGWKRAMKHAVVGALVQDVAIIGMARNNVAFAGRVDRYVHGQ